MKNNKKQGRCPFSPLTLLAALLLIGGMLAIILPVLQWDAEVSAEAVEYEQLREQHQQAGARETVEEETQNQHAVPPVSLAEEGSTVRQSENAEEADFHGFFPEEQRRILIRFAVQSAQFMQHLNPLIFRRIVCLKKTLVHAILQQIAENHRARHVACRFQFTDVVKKHIVFLRYLVFSR